MQGPESRREQMQGTHCPFPKETALDIWQVEGNTANEVRSPWPCCVEFSLEFVLKKTCSNVWLTDWLLRLTSVKVRIIRCDSGSKENKDRTQVIRQPPKSQSRALSFFITCSLSSRACQVTCWLNCGSLGRWARTPITSYASAVTQ